MDLLIRTSGETRLSDFMLWGISGHAVLCFQEVLWPDFSFTDMCYAVWTYQRSAEHSRGRQSEVRSREGRRRGRATRSTIRGGRAGGAGERRDDRRASDGDEREEASGGGEGFGRFRRSREDVGVAESIGTSVAEVSVARSVSSSEPGGGADRFVAERNRAFVRETLETAATVAVTT